MTPQPLPNNGGSHKKHYVIGYGLLRHFEFWRFQKIIDAVGGVNVMNERDIYDASYPGPNYSYETFQLSKGFHHLDGATALRYVRESTMIRRATSAEPNASKKLCKPPRTIFFRRPLGSIRLPWMTCLILWATASKPTSSRPKYPVSQLNQEAKHQ